MNQLNSTLQDGCQKKWIMDPLLFPIMGSHVNRLGMLRVFVGAMGMYLTIPVFAVLHASVVALLLNWLVCPLLGLEPLRQTKYIVLDRYKVKGLSAIDIFNCLFCGWANGICTLLNDAVDQISVTKNRINIFNKFILLVLAVLYTPIALVLQTVLNFLYNDVIAASLGLKRVLYSELIRKINNDRDYAVLHSPWIRSYIKYLKVTWLSLSGALQQIESAWCPIKHFERMEEVVYPSHHKLFFAPEQIDELREYLGRYGSVVQRSV